MEWNESFFCARCMTKWVCVYSAFFKTLLNTLKIGSFSSPFPVAGPVCLLSSVWCVTFNVTVEIFIFQIYFPYSSMLTDWCLSTEQRWMVKYLCTTALCRRMFLSLAIRAVADKHLRPLQSFNLGMCVDCNHSHWEKKTDVSGCYQFFFL